MPIQTPICDFGTNAKDFKLKSTDHKLISLSDIKGDAGTLIMFICNHILTINLLDHYYLIMESVLV